MNIFVLHKNPVKAGKMLCDKHINKMVLESAQMLCTAHWMRNGEAPYKATHKNHPCSKWVRKSYGNYNWLLKHALAIAKEYKRRYKRTHKTFEVLKWCEKNKPKLNARKRTRFVQAMPDKYKDKDSVKAYQRYYIGEKLRFCKWNHSKKPDFIIEYQNRKK